MEQKRGGLQRHLLFLAPLCLALVLSACGGKPSSLPAPWPQVSPAHLGAPARLTAMALLSPAAPLLTATPTRVVPSSPTATPTRAVPPSPTPTATRVVASPTFTPTRPIPSPVPTLIPAKLLAEALAHERNGDYAQALRLLQAVVNSRAAKEREEALFRLGQIYLLEGQLPQATEALEEFRREYPNSEHRARSAFFLARVLKQRGDCGRALSYYEEYASYGNRIGGYLHLAMGECHRNLGHSQQALEEYAKGWDDQALPSSKRAWAMEEGASLYLSQKEYAQAISLYQKVMDLVEQPLRRAALEREIGLAYKAWNQPDKAAEHFKLVVLNYPQTYSAYASLRELDALGRSEVGPYQRGLICYYNGKWQEAVSAFRDSIQKGQDLAGARYHTAISYERAGDLPRALEELEKLLGAHSEGPFVSEGWLARARLQALQGKTEAALATYAQFAAQRPQDPLASEALWQAGQLLEAKALLPRAAEMYVGLADKYPSAKWAKAALFRAGVIYFRLGRYAEALPLWEKLDKEADLRLRSKVNLWMGKALLAQGEKEKGKAHLELASALEPTGFYGLRARELAGQRSVAKEVELSSPEVASESALDGQKAEAWLKGWARPPAGFEGLADLAAALDQDMQLSRGEELLRLGLREEALLEFSAIRNRFWKEPLALYLLALRFREVEVYHLSISCAERLLALSGTSIEGAPKLVKRLAFPIYYSELVQAEAGKRGVSPLLFLALMRQESRFDRYAISSSKARGLTQVIPPTGEYIAQKLGQKGFQVEQLYRPCVSVEFGVWYLAQQLKDFGGNLFYALAAYNGGPTNARRWADSDLDLFVENITLAETRTYVEKVYEQYNFYREIYQPEKGGGR